MPLPALIGVWLFSILIGTAIGSSKGNSGGGFLLSLVLGPLGVLITALLKPTVAVQAQRAEAVDAERARIRAEAMEAARAELRAEQAGSQQPQQPAPNPADPWSDGPLPRRG